MIVIIITLCRILHICAYSAYIGRHKIDHMQNLKNWENNKRYDTIEK